MLSFELTHLIASDFPKSRENLSLGGGLIATFEHHSETKESVRIRAHHHQFYRKGKTFIIDLGVFRTRNKGALCGAYHYAMLKSSTISYRGKSYDGAHLPISVRFIDVDRGVRYSVTTKGTGPLRMLLTKAWASQDEHRALMFHEVYGDIHPQWDFLKAQIECLEVRTKKVVKEPEDNLCLPF